MLYPNTLVHAPQLESHAATLLVSFRGEVIWRCAHPAAGLTYSLLGPETMGVGCWLLAAAFTESTGEVIAMAHLNGQS